MRSNLLLFLIYYNLLFYPVVVKQFELLPNYKDIIIIIIVITQM